MFYPPQQYLISTEQQQYQQEEQQRKELEQLLKQQLLRQTLLLSTPPPSPMSATLGHPNRSCASCKKRKVKCDRKTPSCTACQKSKHRCQYTSYSPPVFTEESQQQQPEEDEQIKAIKQKIEELDNNARQRWEYFQRMMNAYQPTMAKDEFVGSPSAPYYIDDEEIYLNNPIVPTLQQGSQQLLSQQHQLQVPSQQQPVSYMLSQQQYQQRVNTSGAPSFVQAQNVVVSPGNYSPYMSGTITLNYNLNGMRPFLGRNVVPALQSITGGQGPSIPATGFNDVGHLQDWLREKFLSQDWSEEMECNGDSEERFELRPIYEEVNQQNFSVRQKFEVILHRVEFSSSPSPPSLHGGDFQTYDYEEKHNMEMENYSDAGSNRSSVSDLDPMDVFLNKIYAFVRRFIKSLPWLRENFLANWRRSPSLDTFNDGIFSDVVVEVRKMSSYTPYQQDLKIVQNNEIKGRLFF